jgi:hypothetical protein
VTRAVVVSVVAAACVLAACSKAPPNPPAEIVDLSTSIDAFAREFDSHKGEARFVTILSPT